MFVVFSFHSCNFVSFTFKAPLLPKNSQRHLRGCRLVLFFQNTAGGEVKIQKRSTRSWLVLATGSNTEYLSSLVPYPFVHLHIGLQEHILTEGSRINSLLPTSQRSLRACFFSPAYYRMILWIDSRLKLGAIS